MAKRRHPENRLLGYAVAIPACLAMLLAMYSAADGSDPLVKTLRTPNPKNPEDKGYVFSVKYSPDGKLLAAAAGNKEWGAVYVWQTSDWKLAYLAGGHKGYCYDCEFSADGDRLASVSLDGSLRIWDAGTGGLRHQVQPDPPLPIHRVVSSPDGKQFVFEYNLNRSEEEGGFPQGFVQIVDAKTGEILNTPRLHDEEVEDFTYSSDGTLMASGGGFRADLKIWQWPQLELNDTLSVEDHFTRELAISPDGREIAALGYHSLKVWDLATKSLIHSDVKSGFRTDLDYSPDGKLLAMSDWRKIQLLETGQYQTIATFSIDKYWLNSVCFSPDGIHLASGGIDGKVRIWQVPKRSDEEIPQAAEPPESDTDINIREKLSGRELCDQLELQMRGKAELPYSNKELEQIIRDDGPFAKYLAAALLLKSNPRQPAAVKVIRTGMESGEEDRKCLALNALMCSGRSSLVGVIAEKQVTQLLKGESLPLQVCSATILLTDSRQPDRAGVAEVLNQCLDKENAALTFKPIYVSEHTLGCHERAVLLLRYCGESGIKTLEQVALERPENLTEFAVFTLSIMDGPKATQALERLAKSDNTRVASLAKKYLAEKK
jgi:WD40 repeat protein